MGSYFDALGSWIYELGVVVNGYLDYLIPGEVPQEAKSPRTNATLFSPFGPWSVI